MAIRTSKKLPSGRAFISYAYQDEEALEQLNNVLQTYSVTPKPFPPINVAPSEMISNELIDSIMDCRSLIYIDTPNAQGSRWVTLEREYARRSGKPVFLYNPETALIELDERPPLDLPVFPSYTREDKEKVDWIIKFMREERFFDIFLESQDLTAGDSWIKKIESAMYDRLKRGGYTVLFWSSKAAQSKWVQKEVEASLTDFPRQVFVSLLEDVDPPLALMEKQALRLYGEGPYGLDYRRVDDLIVYLYWFMQEQVSIKGEL